MRGDDSLRFPALLPASPGLLHTRLGRRFIAIVVVGLPVLCACASEPRRVIDANPPSTEPELPPAEPGYHLIDWKAVWGPGDDRIAYLHRSQAGEPGGIYEVLLDESRRPLSPRLVLQPPGEVFSFRYSPDAQRLALCMSADIYVLDLAGGDLYRITDRHDAQSPDWHADGEHVIYNRVSWGPGIYAPGDTGNIRIFDLNTGTDEALRLRSGRVIWGGEARMARDGQRVLFRHYRPETGGLEIMLYSPTFDEARRLTSRGWTCDYPRWFQNDSRILFSVEIPLFDPDPWYSITDDGNNLSPFLRPGVILNVGERAEFNQDGTMFALTARDVDSEDGVLWIREVGAEGVADAWQVTDYR